MGKARRGRPALPSTAAVGKPYRPRRDRPDNLYDRTPPGGNPARPHPAAFSSFTPGRGMLEADYLSTVTRPVELFRLAARRAVIARVRLLNAGCCRLFADDLTPALAHALTVLEDHARGHADDDQFAAAAELVWDTERRLADRPADEGWRFPEIVSVVTAAFHPDVRRAADRTAGLLVHLTARRPNRRVNTRTFARRPGERATISRAACELVRDIAGNPFRRWQRIPNWLGGGVIQPDGTEVRLTDTARTLAAVIDRGRHYERLPILADALEEAGVTDAELLAHCRADALHHPGCWAVELVMGRGY